MPKVVSLFDFEILQQLRRIYRSKLNFITYHDRHSLPQNQRSFGDSPASPYDILYAPEFRACIFGDVKRTLRELHEKRVFHRNLEPRNWLWDEQHSRLMLVDFERHKDPREAASRHALTES